MMLRSHSVTIIYRFYINIKYILNYSQEKYPNSSFELKTFPYNLFHGGEPIVSGILNYSIYVVTTL